MLLVVGLITTKLQEEPGVGGPSFHVRVLDLDSVGEKGFVELGEKNGFLEGADLMGIFDADAG